MKKIYIIAILLLLSACGSHPTAAPPSQNSNQNNPPIASVNTASPPPPPNPAPAINIQPTQTAANPVNTNGSIWLQVASPLDDAVINTPQLDVIGSAPAGAVVSVNDAIVIVGSDQQFKATIPIDEGPNLIEVIASNDNGDETSQLLTVTYEP